VKTLWMTWAMIAYLFTILQMVIYANGRHRHD
jgi:hypothetical protein